MQAMLEVVRSLPKLVGYSSSNFVLIALSTVARSVIVFAYFVVAVHIELHKSSRTATAESTKALTGPIWLALFTVARYKLVE